MSTLFEISMFLNCLIWVHSSNAQGTILFELKTNQSNCESHRSSPLGNPQSLQSTDLYIAGSPAPILSCEKCPNQKSVRLLLKIYSTDWDLYWIADTVFINIRRENENKTLDLQKSSMINMTSVTEMLKIDTEVNSRSSLKVILFLFCWCTFVLPKQNIGSQYEHVDTA